MLGHELEQFYVFVLCGKSIDGCQEVSGHKNKHIITLYKCLLLIDVALLDKRWWQLSYNSTCTDVLEVVYYGYGQVLVLVHSRIHQDQVCQMCHNDVVGS